MTRVLIALAMLLAAGCTTALAEPENPLKAEYTDEQIRQAIIQQSTSRYSGNCPCPYSRASNGSRCGGRSAYSRPGGASPVCYAEQVTDKMVERFKESLRGQIK